ncbi:hypothetical protein N2152v2_000219 [Parachlorella kessleri]
MSQLRRPSETSAAALLAVLQQHSEPHLAAKRVFESDWTLLLGDDVRVEPTDWPTKLAGFAADNPHLRCIALLDKADPGFPSFLALHTSHLDAFGGRLLPDQFINQGGDPFLFELYRSFGLARLCSEVSLTNGKGGMEGSIFRSRPARPRYHRLPLDSRTWLDLLRADKRCLAQWLDQEPTLQVDNPSTPEAALHWLRRQQLNLGGKLRVRMNSTNLEPAAGDEAVGSDYIIFWDDDVIPTPSCIDAYVAAFLRHPDCQAFAVKGQPHSLLPSAIHISDVSFFWEAPRTMAAAWGGVIPWAVTANMAAKYNLARFGDGFPLGGGGEDIDYCLKLGGKLRAVPDAAVTHLWWPEGRPWIYWRFCRWALGDGRLLDLWPAYTYWRAPNLPELCLLMGSVLLVLCAFGAATLPRLAAALAGLLLGDLSLDLAYNCMWPPRVHQHPCNPRLRPVAAAEACLIKACSEAGRLWGHLARGRWGNLCRSFDWFCGLDPGVLAREQLWAAGRCALLCTTALLSIGFLS